MGVPFTPPPLFYTPPYPSLGPSAVSPVVFGAFSTSRGHWCVVVRARCCRRISAIVAVSLTRRGGGHWGGEGEGHWGTTRDDDGSDGRSVVMNGSFS